MSGVVCSVCGMGGYWVAYDPTTKEQRCVNHIGSTPESLRYTARLTQKPADPSPSDPASLLERGIDAPTQVQENGGRDE